MIKRKLKFNGRKGESMSRAADFKEEVIEWEMRPGGMLVQRRTDNSDVPITQNLRIRVAYGAARYDISVNPHATFGELKKLLTEETGLQPGEQRIICRGKERENGEYLDMCGVKDRSKVILIEDPESKEKRFIQMRKNAKIQAAHRLINDVFIEIDKLAQQVSTIEKSIGNGKKVAELQITTLIEMLMRQAVKLDNISVEGEACAQKNLQIEASGGFFWWCSTPCKVGALVIYKILLQRVRLVVDKFVSVDSVAEVSLRIVRGGYYISSI